MRVVAEIDLTQAGIDALGRRVGERPVQPGAGVRAGGIALWRAGDVKKLLARLGKRTAPK